MASTYLTAGTMGSVTNRKKFTISFWIKRGALGEEYMFFGYNASSLANYKLQIGFVNDDTLEIRGVDGGTQHTRLVTNRKFRDPNAWSHFYFAFDSTQGTASDRIKIYINGEQETSLSTSTYPNQNTDFAVGVDGGINYTLKIGTWGSGGNYFSGSMSHYYYVDGSVIAHTQFGSTDATTGEWKINTSPTIASYGNEGFLILKDGNTVTDQSPNSNNLTVGGGTLTKTEDNPSNVFACWNRLDKKSSQWNMQYGNTRLVGTGGADWNTRRAISTLGMSSGKFYAEQKLTTAGSDSYPFGVGYDVFENSYSSSMGGNSNFWGFYQPSGGQIYGGGTGSPLQTSLGGGTGDVIGIAIDVDNLTLQFYKNGSTMGTQITGLPSGKTWFFASSGYGNTNTFDCNFGNGYFGTTAVSSAGTNASGIGIFEYDVPSGYTALSTKGLNE